MSYPLDFLKKYKMLQIMVDKPKTGQVVSGRYS